MTFSIFYITNLLEKTSARHVCNRFTRDRHDEPWSSLDLYISRLGRWLSDNIYTTYLFADVYIYRHMSHTCTLVEIRFPYNRFYNRKRHILIDDGHLVQIDFYGVIQSQPQPHLNAKVVAQSVIKAPAQGATCNLYVYSIWGWDGAVP